MSISIFDNPLAHGRWKTWLKKFEVGEEQNMELDEEAVKKIRMSATRMRDEGYYFTTATHEGRFYVKRITYEEWIELPKRRF